MIWRSILIIAVTGLSGIYCAPQKKKSVLIKDLHVDFDISMKKGSAHYTRKFSSPYNKKQLQILKDLYLRNNLQTIKPKSEPSIPLILHHIWVGPRNLSATYKKLMKEWAHYHPSWTHMFWDNAKVKTLKLQNQALYDAAKNPVEKANILRYEILDQYGGLYVDIDTKPLRSFSPLHHRYDFYTGICPADCFSLLNNAVIGCRPGHPIIRACINNIPFYVNKRDRIGRNGALYFSHMFMKRVIDAPGISVAFPASYFYPLNKMFKNNDANKQLGKESFCIHYWASGHEKELPNILDQ